jgi:riboflavin transporter FmnP
MMLTRAEHIALMIATTLCSALALWGLFTAPPGREVLSLDRRVIPLVVPYAFLGMLAGTLVSLHMIQLLWRSSDDRLGWLIGVLIVVAILAWRWQK